MAQHIEIRNIKAPKILQKIGASIEKEVKRGTIRGSLRWDWLFFKTHRDEDRNIYYTNRYIGRGIVFGSTRGDFEVHVKGKVAEHIYLVA